MRQKMIRLFFIILVTILYLVAPLSCAVVSDTLGEWSFPTVYPYLMKAFLIIGPCYFALWYMNRGRWNKVDYYALVLPFIAWFFSFWVSKILFWYIAHGKSLWGPYGCDKGLSNVLLEPSIVGLLSGCYLFRFPLVRISKEHSTWLTSGRMALIITLLGATVGFFFPPLPD